MLLTMAFISVAAALLSLLLTRLAMRAAVRLGLVARPNPVVRTHLAPVPLGGGAVLALVIGGAMLLLIARGDLPARILWAVLPAFALGLADDFLDLSPVPKVSLEFLSVVPYLLLSPLEPVWLVPAALWLVASQNAWNFVDIMDSLAGWVAVFAFGAAVAVFSQATGGLAVLCAASAAATLGFLFWNSYPARIYMGDSGSLALGVLFGALILEAWLLDRSLLIPLGIAGAVPYFETAFIFSERTRRGIPFYRGSADHFALRLQHAGWCIPAIIRRVKLVAAALAALGTTAAVFRHNRWLLIALLVIFIACAAAAWIRLSRLAVWENSGSETR